ncbi:MAG: FKBP-type peptidyl-prolyl cis-trans isomerase, partial [Bacteroidales bacterium]|nr:FKBP-type peptidyl-prolyl cis-trans isomerase [Bacteroidales bacterium]
MPPTSAPVQFYLGGGLVDGFTTALMNMHEGDRWTVYMPYQLGYGTSASSSIPAYSLLTFDITLVSFFRPGTGAPEIK